LQFEEKPQLLLKLKVIKYHKKREKEKETKRGIGYSFLFLVLMTETISKHSLAIFSALSDLRPENLRPENPFI
jgi:hypothetical protein